MAQECLENQIRNINTPGQNDIVRLWQMRMMKIGLLFWMSVSLRLRASPPRDLYRPWMTCYLPCPKNASWESYERAYNHSQSGCCRVSAVVVYCHEDYHCHLVQIFLSTQKNCPRHGVNWMLPLRDEAGVLAPVGGVVVPDFVELTHPLANGL